MPPSYLSVYRTLIPAVGTLREAASLDDAMARSPEARHKDTFHTVASLHCALEARMSPRFYVAMSHLETRMGQDRFAKMIRSVENAKGQLRLRELRFVPGLFEIDEELKKPYGGISRESGPEDVIAAVRRTVSLDRVQWLLNLVYGPGVRFTALPSVVFDAVHRHSFTIAHAMIHAAKRRLMAQSLERGPLSDVEEAHIEAASKAVRAAILGVVSEALRGEHARGLSSDALDDRIAAELLIAECVASLPEGGDRNSG